MTQEEEFYLKSKRTLQVQQRVSKRYLSENDAKDEQVCYGIIDGLAYASAAPRCSNTKELREQVNSSWRGAGVSDIIFYTKKDGALVSLDALEKPIPLPEILVAELKNYMKEDLPDYPWHTGALRGFLKGITGRTYVAHKVEERGDSLLIAVMYHDPQAPVYDAKPKAEQKEQRSLENYLQQQNFKLRQFNIVNADETPQKIYDLLAAVSNVPSTAVTCVTQAHPKVIREKLPNEAVRVVWISSGPEQELPKNFYQIPPGAIEHQLKKSIVEYLAEAYGEGRTPVIGVTHVEQLLDVNGEKKVKDWLTTLNHKLADFDGFGVLALSPESITDKVAASIARAAEGL